MQGALDLVKDELGPNAFVLSTQRRTKKGLLGLGVKEVFEIQAAPGANDKSLSQPERLVLTDSRQIGVARTAAERVVLNQTPKPQSNRSLSTTDDTDDFLEMVSLLPYSRTSAPASIQKPTIHREATKQNPSVAQVSIEEELRSLTKTISGIIAAGSDGKAAATKATKDIVKPVVQTRVYRTARLTEPVKTGGSITSNGAQAAAVRQPVASVDYSQQIENHLTDSGLDAEVMRLLLPATDTGNQSASFQDLRSQIGLRLSQIVETSPVDELLQGNVRAAVLLGPTGVGKTTTIAKLAARAILKYNRRVVLVTLDTYRIGAIKQLGTYAEIIGVPLKVAKNVSDVESIISESPKDSLVLIDTIGRSPFKLGEMADNAEYFKNESSIRKYLILSATTNTRDNLDISAHFDVFGIDHTIITKADETSRYGTMINCLARLGRPVDYITTGQNVPEDIRTAGEETITDLLFDGLKS
jgi:flagellar biosynthesis protein FlhF